MKDHERKTIEAVRDALAQVNVTLGHVEGVNPVDDGTVAIVRGCITSLADVLTGLAVPEVVPSPSQREHLYRAHCVDTGWCSEPGTMADAMIYLDRAGDRPSECSPSHRIIRDDDPDWNAWENQA